jgi:uncharacterized membrane protein
MELGVLFLVGLFGFYLIILPILVFTSRGRLTRLEAEAAALRQELASLRSRTATAVAAPAPAAAEQPAATAPAPPPEAVAPVPEPAPAPAPLPALAPLSLPPLTSEIRVPALPPVASEPALAEPLVAAPVVPASVMPDAAAPLATARDEAAAAAVYAEESAASASFGSAAVSGDAGTATVPTTPPVFPPPPPAPPAAAGGGRRGFDWENLVGVKLFSAIAGIALLFAAVFFLRFSVEHGWLQPPVRVAIGVIVAIGLLVVCELKAADRYRVTANALDASGIAILFSTFFAAHALWELIPAWLTFLLLVIVTALAVLLSIRRASVFIAVLGLLGGFAAPALLSSGQNNPIGLFGYLLLLNAGLAWVAHTKRWPILTGLTLVFTTIYQWGWVLKFLTAASLPLAAGIFLVFPLLTLFMTTLSERFRDAGGGGAAPDGKPAAAAALTRPFGDTPGLSAIMPFLLATYLAAVPQYGERFGVLFGFLFLIDIGLFVVAMMRRAAALHLVSGVTTLMVFAVWFGLSYGDAAWPVILLIIAVFALLYLLMPVVATRFNRPLEGAAARAVYTSPLLLAAFPVLVLMEPSMAQPLLPFGVLAALLIAMAAYAVARDEGGVYFAGAFFAVISELYWSGRYLTAGPGRLYSGLIVYFIFALIFIAVPSAARRFGRELRPRGAGGMLALATLLLAFFLAGPAVAHASLWGLAGLIGLVLAGLTYESRASGRPWLAPLAAGLGWIVLWVWWGTSSLTRGLTAADHGLLLPALAVITGVSLLTLGMAVWLRPRLDSAEPVVGGGMAPADVNLLQSLIGHMFLFFVAANGDLAMPPWPVFAVLFVLDLALAAAALHQRRGSLQIGAMLGSVVVLFSWSLTIEVMPWSLVAVIVALALPIYAIAMTSLASRVAYVLRGFLVGVALAGLGAQLIMISAGAARQPPLVVLLIAAHVALLGTLLTLAGREREQWPRFVWWPLLTTTLVELMWRFSPALKDSWQVQLALPAALYACFVAYPLVLRDRVGSRIEPYRVAVLASVPFFFFARRALLDGGFEPVIGGLAVAQALVMLVLLRQLLRLEPPGARTLGRLALVAGAALAFVTLAIPLQLDRQWLTVAWALEGAALAWLYGRIPHRGLLLACTALLTVVFVRLAMNPQVFVYAPRSSVRILNWYLYAYLISAASCLVAARLLARTEDRLVAGLPRISSLLPALGTVLLFLLLNIEIADYYATGPTLEFRFSATLAQDLTYTLGWGMFAIGLLVVGIRGRIRNARLASIGLLLVTVFKCFLHDLGRLGGLYLVASFVGLAICLALVALALQRFVLAEPKDAV